MIKQYRKQVLHRCRCHRVADPEGAGGARGGRRLDEEGAEQDELPAEERGGGPHAPPVRRLVSPRARGPAHGVRLSGAGGRGRRRGGHAGRGAGAGPRAHALEAEADACAQRPPSVNVLVRTAARAHAVANGWYPI